MNTRLNRPLMVLNSTGDVIGMNDAARVLVGECVGRLCWDAVGALDKSRRPVCQPGCSAALAEEPNQRHDRVVNLRGKQVHLNCSQVGELVVVQISESTPKWGARLPVGEEGPSSLSSSRLSPREREVLQLLALGNTAPAAADRLCIGVATVRTHLSRARQKLGASSQAAAVAIALRLGEID